MSKCARTKAVIRETGELGGDSCGDFGFDGNLPRRPFKESVLTTWTKTKSNLSISKDPSNISSYSFVLPSFFPFYLFPERENTHFLHHPDHQALLEATKLATIPPAFVNGASFLGQAHVFRPLLHGPLEESFATLAGTNAVVLTRCRVAAHGAKLAGARRCPLVPGSAPRRWGADGAPCPAAAAARLRGFRAPATVDQTHKHLRQISLERDPVERNYSSNERIERREVY